MNLPPRPANVRVARNDRRRAAVISDWDVFVVGEQRIVRPEHAADVAGVIYRCVEVGVIADDSRQSKLGLVHRHEHAAGDSWMVMVRRGVDPQQIA